MQHCLSSIWRSRSFQKPIRGREESTPPRQPQANSALPCRLQPSGSRQCRQETAPNQSSAEREVSILGARVWQLFQIPPQEEYWPHCPQTPLSQCGYPTNNSKEDLGMANDSEGHMASLETVSSIPSSLNFRPSRLGLVTSPCTEI